MTRKKKPIKYASIKPRPETHQRLKKFMFDLAAARSEEVTQDDALSELLRRAGY